jgi:hypothetical protein
MLKRRTRVPAKAYMAASETHEGQRVGLRLAPHAAEQAHQTRLAAQRKPEAGYVSGSLPRHLRPFFRSARCHTLKR